MIVRAGSGFPGVGPLVPVRAWTIEGRARFGGTRSWSPNARFLADLHVRRLARHRGLGAVVNYCLNNPPDAATQAIIAARGDTMNLIDCSAANAPASASAPVAPVYQPPTDIEDCAALGLATQAGQACVQRNTARAVAAENAQLAADAAFNVARCIANNGDGYVPPGMAVSDWCQQTYGNPNVPAYLQPVLSPAAASQAPPPSASVSIQINPGSLSFRNLTGGDAVHFIVGDRWSLSISGASPNQPVVVAGGQNGSSATTQMGVTDQNGNWSTSGTMDTSTIGQWSEDWRVGGVRVAQFGFTVSPASQAPASTGQGAGGGTGRGGGGSAASGGFNIGEFLTSSAFMGIPNWVLLAGGAGLLFVFGGSHGR